MIFTDCPEALFQQHAGQAAVRKYLEDFWLVAPPGSPDDASAYRAMKDVCATVRVPLAAEKCVALKTTLTLIGVRIDTSNMTVGLPLENCRPCETLSAT